MTITLHWWMIPIALVLAGFIVGSSVGSKQNGDWDFFTPLFGAAIILGSLIAAVSLVIGHFIR